MAAVFTAIQADITTLDVDALVTSADCDIWGPRGELNAAVHRVAGPQLAITCQLFFDPCPAGTAKLAPGYGLTARFVVLTVCPQWQGGFKREAEQLTSCYRAALEMVAEPRFASIAFPCLGTGSHGFPSERAAEIAIRTVREHVGKTPLKQVTFCCANDEEFSRYQRLLAG